MKKCLLDKQSIFQKSHLTQKKSSTRKPLNFEKVLILQKLSLFFKTKKTKKKPNKKTTALYRKAFSLYSNIHFLKKVLNLILNNGQYFTQRNVQNSLVFKNRASHFTKRKREKKKSANLIKHIF